MCTMYLESTVKHSEQHAEYSSGLSSRVLLRLVQQRVVLTLAQRFHEQRLSVELAE